MHDNSPSNGIDFFDFLYEIWRAKWLFGGIVFLCVVASVAQLAYRQTMEANASHQVSGAVFSFSIREGVDPLGRDRRSIVGDLLRRVNKSTETLGLRYGSAGINGSTPTDSLVGYRLTFDEGVPTFGTLAFQLRNADETVYRSVYDAFFSAAKSQAQDTRKHAQSLIDGVGSAFTATASAPLIVTDNNVYRSMAFVNMAEVKDGTWRFFDFGPLEFPKPVEGHLVKRVFTGGIVGIIIAGVTTMFRIAIRRRRSAAR